jgi:hypothetical protein
MWLKMAKVASATLAADTDDKQFYEAKLLCAKHWALRFSPQASALRHEVEAGAETIMGLPAEAFAA